MNKNVHNFLIVQLYSAENSQHDKNASMQKYYLLVESITAFQNLAHSRWNFYVFPCWILASLKISSNFPGQGLLLLYALHAPCSMLHVPCSMLHAHISRNKCILPIVADKLKKDHKLGAR